MPLQYVLVESLLVDTLTHCGLYHFHMYTVVKGLDLRVSHKEENTEFQ